MDWTPEAQQIDLEVERIIRRDKQPEKLKEFFPDAEALVKFSNETYPYPYRRNSVLALAVQSESSDVLDRIWEMYFSGDNDRLNKLKLEFLNGRDSVGRRFNHHYFAQDMNPIDRIRAEQFCSDDPEDAEMYDYRIRNGLIPEDTRSEAQKERGLMYEMIRHAYIDLLGRVDDDAGDLPPETVRLYPGAYGRRLMRETPGPDKTFVLQREAQTFSKIVLNKNNHQNICEVLENLNCNSRESFSRQAFRQMDFPELFYWAYAPLNNLQKILQYNQKRRNFSDLANFFAVHNGILTIDYQNMLVKSNGVKPNTVRANDAFNGYCYVNPQTNEPVVGLASWRLRSQLHPELKGTLPHELTHSLEKVRCVPKGKDRLSDMDVVKFAFMALYMESRYLSLKNRFIHENIMQAYNVESYPSEFVARIMENRNFRDNRMLKNLEHLINRYNRAKLDGDFQFIKSAETLMRRKLPNYKLIRGLYKEFIGWNKQRVALDKMREDGKSKTEINIQRRKVATMRLHFTKQYRKIARGWLVQRLDKQIADIIGINLLQKTPPPRIIPFLNTLQRKALEARKLLFR